jgi:hypothetical protein
MASNSYMNNRKKFQRPQAILWADNPGTLSAGTYTPDGYEVGTKISQSGGSELQNSFLILSDHNRAALDFKPMRIEKKERMINGRMRSYHIADKLTLSTSWEMLPSRSYAEYPDFDSTTGISLQAGKSGSFSSTDEEYTADGGAGGIDIINWYENHEGPFWVYLAYDRLDNFEGLENQYNRLNQYNQIIEMYISDISYTVQSRSNNRGDLWNISVTLEEA